MRRVTTVLVAVLLLGGCGYAGLDDLPMPGGPDLGDDSFVVAAEFDDVLDLARRATVKLDGVTVGEVESIARDGWDARVELRLRGDVDLPSGTTARIAQTSLLGEKFVALSRPERDATGRLGEGSTIALSATSRGAEVEEVLGSLSLLLNGGGIAQLQTVTRELHAALDTGDGDTVRFLEELDTFVTTLDRNRDTIVTTLEHLDELTRTIDADREVVASALDEIGPGVQVLADQQRELTRMLTSLDTFATVTTDTVREVSDDLVADLEALEPTLAALAASGDALPQALEVILSFPFPDEVLDAVQGDYVNLDVQLDLSPLEIVDDVSGGVVDTGALGEVLGEVLPPAPDAEGGAVDTDAGSPGLVGGLGNLLAGLLGGAP